MRFLEFKCLEFKCLETGVTLSDVVADFQGLYKCFHDGKYHGITFYINLLSKVGEYNTKISFIWSSKDFDYTPHQVFSKNVLFLTLYLTSHNFLYNTFSKLSYLLLYSPVLKFKGILKHHKQIIKAKWSVGNPTDSFPCLTLPNSKDIHCVCQTGIITDFMIREKFYTDDIEPLTLCNRVSLLAIINIPVPLY